MADYLLPPPHIVSKLPKIISSRKKEVQEEARRKLAADAELIRNYTGGRDSGESAVDILPKETWKKVLAFLDDPKDVENARRTCSVFKEILEEKYFSRVLFPQVFQLENFRCFFDNLPTQEQEEEEEKKKKKEVDEEEEKKKDDELTGEIINLRSVSKEWRDGVDAYFEEDLKKSWSISPWPLPPTERREPHAEVRLLANCTNGYQRVVDRMLADLRNRGNGRMVKPKLFLRNVSVDIDHFRRLQSDGNKNPRELAWILLFKVAQVLELIGNQVWHFSVKMAPSSIFEDIRICHFYTVLCKWVRCLPELRGLKLELVPRRRDASTMNELRVTVLERPFPVLPKLDYLDEYFLDLEDSCIAMAILSSNPNVKNFKFAADYSFPAVEVLHQLRETIQQPTRMSLGGIAEFYSRPLHELCPTILSSNWPLKALRIWGEQANLPCLFRFIENFQTLESLELGMLKLRGGDPGFLKLPNLNYFNFVFGLGEREDNECDWIFTDGRDRDEVFYELDSEEELSEGEMESFMEYEKKDLVKEMKTIRKFSVDFLFPMKKLETLVWRYLDLPLKDEVIDDAENWEHEIIKFRGGQIDLDESNIWDILPKLKTAVVENRPEGFMSFDMQPGNGYIYERTDKFLVEDSSFNDDDE